MIVNMIDQQKALNTLCKKHATTINSFPCQLLLEIISNIVLYFILNYDGLSYNGRAQILRNNSRCPILRASGHERLFSSTVAMCFYTHKIPLDYVIYFALINSL